MKRRAIRIEGEVAFVPLTQGYEAIIDAADVPLVGGWLWHADVKHHPDGRVSAVYAARSRRGSQGKVLMHRLIANTPDGMETDHEDADGLNNRRKNLRNATTSQNQANSRRPINNTSGGKGVYLHRATGRWMARISANGQRHYLGLFDRISDACAAYAEASARLHGEFGRTA